MPKTTPKTYRASVDVMFAVGSGEDVLAKLTRIEDHVLSNPAVLALAGVDRAVRLTQSQATSGDWPLLGTEVVE